MTHSNGFVIIPENIEGLEKGEYVTVLLFDVIPVINENV
jgi:molybdopterin biosynthesis enzyme